MRWSSGGWRREVRARFLEVSSWASSASSSGSSSLSWPLSEFRRLRCEFRVLPLKRADLRPEPLSSDEPPLLFFEWSESETSSSPFSSSAVGSKSLLSSTPFFRLLVDRDDGGGCSAFVRD
jgi:hypothetical protein